jgi:predicted cobalt transporter CbtA
MAATSPSFPATEAVAQPRPGHWLRTAQLAALPAALAAVAVEVLGGRGVLDRAIASEEVHAGPLAGAMFTPGQQRAGMVLGEVLYATGVAAILAGLLVLGGGRRPPRERWAVAAFAGAWAMVIVPAIAYPPLPPGVASGLDITVRQWSFAACAVLGAGAVVGAVHAWRALDRLWRPVAAVALLAAAPIVAVGVLPDQRAASAPDDLLRDFRLVTVASQLMFWIVLGVVGALLTRSLRGLPPSPPST